MILVLLVALLSYCIPALSALVEVEKDHLYSWEEKQSDGTTLYYGLELGMMDKWKERASRWSAYYMQIDRCAQFCFRYFVTQPEAKVRVALDSTKDLDPNLKQRLQAAIAQRGPKAKESIRYFSAGRDGKSFGENIAYISRSPIKTRMKLPLVTDRALSLQEVYDHYGDIIMTVWVTPRGDGSVAYENRGIIRNPFSMLFDEYKGLSIKFHAFTGLVMEYYYGSLFLHVRPAPAMCELLLRAFDRTEIFYGDLSSPPQLGDFTNTVPEDLVCAFDPPLSFSVESLKKKIVSEEPQAKEVGGTIAGKGRKRIREEGEKKSSANSTKKRRKEQSSNTVVQG